MFIMLKFGKRITFRPLIISLAFGIAFGMFGNELANPSIGFITGVFFFLLILLGYYWGTSKTLFNYWEVNQDTVNYRDNDNASNRLLMLIFPTFLNLKTFSKKDIQSVSINGNFNLKQMPFALIYNAGLGMFSGAISMTNNQVSLSVTLKNGQKIKLDISRDIIYNKKETIEKLNQFLDGLDSDVTINNYSHGSNNVRLSF